MVEKLNKNKIFAEEVKTLIYGMQESEIHKMVD
jgi:hypothetical protein